MDSRGGKGDNIVDQIRENIFFIWGSLLSAFLFIYLIFTFLSLLFSKSTPELAKLWNVGSHMWKRDFPSIYTALKEEWSPAIKPIMTALQGKI